MAQTKKHRRQMHIKSILGMLLGKIPVVSALLLVQIAVLVFSVKLLADNFARAYAFFVGLSAVILVWLMNKAENPSYKLPWAVIIAGLPVFGGLLYLILGNKALPKKTVRRYTTLQKEERILLEEGAKRREIPYVAEKNRALAQYLRNCTGAPVWQDTSCRYFPLGEYMWKSLLEDLKAAKKCIFMEFFILEQGEMLNPILQILQEKAADGVDVRMLYDDLGSLQTLPMGFAKKLRTMGIKCAVFNPLGPHMNGLMNFRDHRKIVVIDGDIGYCGGVNLADEYINAYPKLGHWKDTAVRLEGRGVWSLTVLFGTLWQFADTKYVLDAQQFAPSGGCDGDGCVQPFGDSPFDRINVCEDAYMHIINRAVRYVYITSPYLIIDHEMLTSLQIAAKSGVDVRILTPAHGDKWFVHQTTRSFYTPLLEAGVRIFEYTPGFVHAKMYVSDDDTAIVGTANMDFRSFYLHFECGVAFYGGQVVRDVKKDVLEQFAKSKEIPVDYGRTVALPIRLIRALLRLLAPMM